MEQIIGSCEKHLKIILDARYWKMAQTKKIEKMPEQFGECHITWNRYYEGSKSQWGLTNANKHKAIYKITLDNFVGKKTTCKECGTIVGLKHKPNCVSSRGC